MNICCGFMISCSSSVVDYFTDFFLLVFLRKRGFQKLLEGVVFRIYIKMYIIVVKMWVLVNVFFD